MGNFLFNKCQDFYKLSLQEKMQLALQGSAVALLFTIPVSTTLTTVMTFVYLFFLVITHKIKEIPQYFKSAIFLSILLFLLLNVMGILYTVAPFDAILIVFKKYSRLLLLPLLIPAFREFTWRNRGLAAFLVGLLISILYSNLVFYKNSIHGFSINGLNLHAISKIYIFSFLLYHLFCFFRSGYFNLFKKINSNYKNDWECKFYFILIPTIYIIFIYNRDYMGSDFKDHIFTSTFVAFGICVLLYFYKVLKLSKALKVRLFCIGILFLHYLFFVNRGRTGQVLFFILMGLFFWDSINKENIKKLSKSLLMISVFVIAGLSVINFLPNHIKEKGKGWISESTHMSLMIPKTVERFKEAYQSSLIYLQKCQKHVGSELPPMTDNIDSSLRVEYYVRTLKLCSMRSWFGWGTGSFRTAYNTLYPDMPENHAIANPHNQYLLTYAELGIPGLLALLLIFGSIAWHAVRLKNKFESKILLGIVLSMMVGCLFNSWFLDFTSLYFFVCMVAVIAAPSIHEKYLLKTSKVQTSVQADIIPGSSLTI